MRTPVTIRASSLPELFDCSARWEAKYINGMRLPSTSNSVLGSAVHAGTALYDFYGLEGSPISIDDASTAVVDTIHKPNDDIDWEDDKQNDVEKIALALHSLYCTQIAPQQQYVAVETTCEHLHIAELGITLTGTTDRIRKDDTGYAIADIKTGKNAVASNGEVKTQGHTSQIAVYELLAEVSTGLPMTSPAQIIGLQTAKTDKGIRAGIGTIEGGRELLIGDEENPGYLQYASMIIHNGIFPGNPKSMMCHKKYCPNFLLCKWRK